MNKTVRSQNNAYIVTCCVRFRVIASDAVIMIGDRNCNAVPGIHSDTCFNYIDIKNPRNKIGYSCSMIYLCMLTLLRKSASLSLLSDSMDTQAPVPHVPSNLTNSVQQTNEETYINAATKRCVGCLPHTCICFRNKTARRPSQKNTSHRRSDR